jgi:hypothetical protein
MSWREKCFCDECGAMRTEASQFTWLLKKLVAGWLQVRRWSDEEATHDDVQHLCGDTCYHKALQRHLAAPERAAEAAQADEPEVELNVAMEATVSE